MNHKGHASSSSGNPNKPIRKVNTVLSLRSGREVDNKVRNPNESCRFSHQFFQNSLPSSTPETDPFTQSRHTPDGVPNASDSPPSQSPSKEEEPQEKDSSSSASSSPPKSSSPFLLRKSRCPCLLSHIG